jgi:hypothetical protein
MAGQRRICVPARFSLAMRAQRGHHRSLDGERPGMGFFAFLKSLDELLYEIMSWLVFYPVTLWRAVRHPLRMMNYADSELGDAVGQQYTDTLSPPLFLLLTLLIGRAVELSLVGEGALVEGTKGLQILIKDDVTLILFRVALFSLFPVAFAVRLIRAQRKALTRDTLRAPFYSQCYAAAPFAMLIGIAGSLIALPAPAGPLAVLGFTVVALLWYGTLEIRWFAQHLDASLLRAFGQASIAMIECLVAVGFITWLFSGYTVF